ncbi:phage antirepressor N-terminal domain-containing protein [Paracoccus sp. P2]|uniref:phage antirepressor N-terminal domain-containing protein n=1 Tax=Paracoccus sp. P2 TaxID=3248840 RepID=UPI00391FADF4
MGNIITVNFRQDTLFAVERDDGVFVAVKPICDSLGLAWQSQHQRIKDDPVLSEGITTIVIPSPGGAQETTCLKLELVNGWLFKVDSRRVKDEETRQRLLTYQRECHHVLFEHFYGKRHEKPEVIVEKEASENENVRLRMVTESRQVFGHQAAAQLWFKLGLPVVPAMLQDPRQLSLFDYSTIKTAGEAA